MSAPFVVVVSVEGGIVQQVYGPEDEVVVVVIDHDGTAEDPGTPVISATQPMTTEALDPETLSTVKRAVHTAGLRSLLTENEGRQWQEGDTALLRFVHGGKTWQLRVEHWDGELWWVPVGSDLRIELDSLETTWPAEHGWEIEYG